MRTRHGTGSQDSDSFAPLYFELWKLFLFGLGFVAIGTMVLTCSIAFFVKAGVNFGSILVCAVGLLFTSVGLTAILRVRYVCRATARQREAKSKWPKQPWMWRDDWRNGEVVYSPWPTAWGTVFLAAFWNSISYILLAGFATAKEALPVLAISGFCVIGAFYAAIALRNLLIARKWGRGYLKLQQSPLVSGKTLVGQVHLPAVFDVNDGVRISLQPANEEPSSESADNRRNNTYEPTDWISSRIVKSLLPEISDSKTGKPTAQIPVALDIPQHDPSSLMDNRVDEDDQLAWKLVVVVQKGLLPYEGHFELPVYPPDAVGQSIASRQTISTAKYDPHLANETFEEIVARRHGTVKTNTASRIELAFRQTSPHMAALSIAGKVLFASMCWALAMVTHFWGLGIVGYSLGPSIVNHANVMTTCFALIVTLFVARGIGWNLSTVELSADDSHIHRRQGFLFRRTRSFALRDIKSIHTNDFEGVRSNGLIEFPAFRVILDETSGRSHVLVKAIETRFTSSAIAVRLQEHVARFS